MPKNIDTSVQRQFCLTWNMCDLQSLLPFHPPILLTGLGALLVYNPWMFQYIGRILQTNCCEIKNFGKCHRVTDSAQDQLCLLFSALQKFCQFTWLQSEQLSQVPILITFHHDLTQNWRNDFVKRDRSHNFKY